MSRLKHSYSYIRYFLAGILCFGVGLGIAFKWPTVTTRPAPYQTEPTTSVPTEETKRSENTPVTRSLQLIIFDPILESKNGTNLRTYKNWVDPVDQTQQAIQALHELSGGYLTYTIKDIQTFDRYVPFPDGFTYDDGSYLSCLDSPKTCHADYIDYHRLVTTYGLCNTPADEVWIWGGPYFNFDTFRPIHECEKKFYVMGFNYERDLPIMLFAIGGRMDSILRYRIANDFTHANGFVPFKPTGNDAWTKFVRACGTSYAPPNTDTFSENSIFDRKKGVVSNCNAWVNFPNLESASSETITCEAWGCDNAGFQRFWFSRIPRSPGYTNDTNGKIYNNWWKYYINL